MSLGVCVEVGQCYIRRVFWRHQAKCVSVLVRRSSLCRLVSDAKKEQVGTFS